jgi:ABC-type Fe3+-siderophore transport system permease subunit
MLHNRSKISSSKRKGGCSSGDWAGKIRPFQAQWQKRSQGRTTGNWSSKKERMMGLIYLGVILVLAGAMLILLTTYVLGSPTVQHIGTVTALLGFVLYLVGRIQYRRLRNSSTRPNQL